VSDELLHRRILEQQMQVGRLIDDASGRKRDLAPSLRETVIGDSIDRAHVASRNEQVVPAVEHHDLTWPIAATQEIDQLVDFGTPGRRS
jgi:hypothetical protein